MDGPERLAKLLKQYPPPDPQSPVTVDQAIATADWLLGLTDQIEAEGERLEHDPATQEVGRWLAKQGRAWRWSFHAGVQLNQSDPGAADRFLEEHPLAG